MVMKPFKIGPFEMSLRLFFFVFVLMELVPGAKNQDSAGFRPAGGRPPAGRRPASGRPEASLRPAGGRLAKISSQNIV